MADGRKQSTYLDPRSAIFERRGNLLENAKGSGRSCQTHGALWGKGIVSLISNVTQQENHVPTKK